MNLLSNPGIHKKRLLTSLLNGRDDADIVGEE